MRVEPVLQDIEKELEEAAFSLGANHWQTFIKIIFPVIVPSLLTGSAMAFARGLGEYGSVVFISGNMPMKTEIIPLLITAGMDIAPIISRLFHAKPDNITPADWQFLHDQRAAALKIINDRSRDVPRPA